MKTRHLVPLLLALGLSATGCSTLDSLNPWASSGPKMTPLTPIVAEAEVRTVWSASVGKCGNYTFVPT
ncbi:MAG: outer membrane protein assembly factor BamB, partial [Betaproteobacteria bacterium]